MQIGLIGLPRGGKSTLFTAIAGGHVHAGAGAAHQADKAVVKVPDPRIEALSAIYKPKKSTHAMIGFLDIPGLDFSEEAGRHESRRIIAQARQADMLVIVLGAFHSSSVAAYRKRVDPAKDLEELDNEFLLADLEMVANRIEKLKVSVMKPTKTVENDKKELILLERCQAAVEEMKPVSAAIQFPEEEKMLRSFGFLTLKPMLIVANVDEDKIATPVELAGKGAREVITLSAPLEVELAALDEADREAFLRDMNLEEIARHRLIKKCYQTLKLISFLTVGEDEVRAWTIPAGCPAVEAAGAIHSDIQRGFIRAETVRYDDFMATGDMKGAKAAGKVRLEGKTYAVQDGDIINFRFNV
jgi:ribosome-binding ATPase